MRNLVAPGLRNSAKKPKNAKFGFNKINNLQIYKHLSRRKPGFKSPWDYQNKNKGLERIFCPFFLFYDGAPHAIPHIQNVNREQREIR